MRIRSGDDLGDQPPPLQALTDDSNGVMSTDGT